MSKHMTSDKKSIFKYSSELGLPMGLYFFAISASLLASVHVNTTILLLFPLALGWPVILFLLMRNVWKKAPHYRTTGAMWLTGIWICIFGALICAILSAAWILLFEPDFLQLYLNQCLNIASSSSLPEQYSDMTSQIKTMVDAGHIPSPMQWVFSMIWLTAFTGAIISLIVALCMTLRRSPHPDKFP